MKTIEWKDWEIFCRVVEGASFTKGADLADVAALLKTGVSPHAGVQGSDMPASPPKARATRASTGVSAPPAPEASRVVPLQPKSETEQAAVQMPEIEVRPSNQPSDSLNPAPPFPASSRHLREAGRVVVRVLIAADGWPLDVVLQRSSGFERLDQVSLETVRTWRFDPAAYRGNSEARWVHVPITFVQE